VATFGKTTAGSSFSASTAPRVWASTASPASTGVVQGGTARIWLDASGSTSVKMALYADSSGAPGALLAESDAVTVTSTTEGDQAFTFSGANQVTVTSGVSYWIAVAWNDPGTPSLNVSRDGTATSRREQTVASWPTLPDPFGTPTANNTGPIAASITYTPGGGTARRTAGFLQLL
jgi:hypothetical protein